MYDIVCDVEKADILDQLGRFGVCSEEMSLRRRECSSYVMRISVWGGYDE